MAAHNYYHAQSSHPSTYPTPYYDYSSRTDSPLPDTYPPQSPFDDRSHPYRHETPSQSNAGASGRLHDDADPFDDHNAIPLNGRKTKDNTTNIVSPIEPHDQDDPFVRDADPRRKKRRVSKDGWFTGKITWVVYVLSAAQLIVFIAEIARNAVLTGTPIQLKPSFNYLIGPSQYLMINMGARFQPCMHTMHGVQDNSVPISWPCPNATSNHGDSVTCQLSDLCGFSADRNPRVSGSLDDKPAPNQWWRFIVPIFLHAGLIHIGFNLLLQLSLGRDVERLIGSVRFAILYFAAGIFGFVLGGNFAATGIASTGCSGSLFGILAITLLDLLYTWKERKSPIKDLLFIGIDMIIAFVLGLLPGLDNFSHIGGFLMGLVLGVCLLRSPSEIARRRDVDEITAYTYAPPQEKRSDGLRGFVKAPLGFFQNRRGVWWLWILIRAAALLGALIALILLLKNFYVWKNTCSWCKYLSCLPITVSGSNWCSIGNLDFTPTTSSSSSKRHLLDLTKEAFEFARRA